MFPYLKLVTKQNNFIRVFSSHINYFSFIIFRNNFNYFITVYISSIYKLGIYKYFCRNSYSAVHEWTDLRLDQRNLNRNDIEYGYT